MTKMSSLPRDLVEEILSRVPISLKRVRLTCKMWNTLSKDVSFQKKHISQAKVAANVANEKEFLVVVMMELRVYMMRINLHKNVAESSYRIKLESQFITLDKQNQIGISPVSHCDGLLLCILKYQNRLVVWNPNLGKTRWIDPMHESHIHFYNYALGYEKSSKKSCHGYKILTFNYEGEYNLYYFNSDSWRVLDDITQNEYTNSRMYDHGISLKGNTYWFSNGFLVCFDFTKENYSPPFPLPFEWSGSDSVALSSVRDEQLAVLIQQHDTLEMEIWVTNKIEPNAVSWRSKSFLAFNMNSFDYFPFSWNGLSFFIDEEKKVAVIFDDKTIDLSNYTYDIVAYIVGVDGSYKEMNLGESEYKHRVCQHWYPPVCSYVPSLVQLI